MNWGVIGYGEIAPSFIEGLGAVDNATLKGIASVSRAGYLKKHGLYPDVNIYDSYQDLLDEPEIDIVYIATVNNLHRPNVFAALDAGKHVLCEKPLGVSQDQALEMISLARAKDLYLLEGMWTRFLPAYRQGIEIIKSGEIGKPYLLQADFGFLSHWPPHRRLLNPDLFGGTLLDNADYNVFLSQDIFEAKPQKISAFARFAETGVEDMCGIMLQYPDDQIAQLFSSFKLKTEQRATIYGERGFVQLNEYWHGSQVILNKEGNNDVTVLQPEVNGFEYEIRAVENDIAKGRTENCLVSHAVSLEVAEILEEVKSQIGS